MNAQELKEAVRLVMGKDPIEMVVSYYKGLIQMHADDIAEHQKEIHKLQKSISDLKGSDDLKTKLEIE